MSRFRSLSYLRGFEIPGEKSGSAAEQYAHKAARQISFRHLTSGKWLCTLAAASLLALSGCASVQVRLGMKVYLNKIPVASIKANLPKGPGIAPGQKLPLVVTLTEPNGKILQTEGAGHGKVLWKDLVVTPSVVTANQKGVVSLSRDPRVSDGKLAHVVITIPSHPDVRADFDIPVRYDHAFTSNFSGSPGSSGLDGSNGTDGFSGSMGSTDPNNPSAGETARME